MTHALFGAESMHNAILRFVFDQQISIPTDLGRRLERFECFARRTIPFYYV